MKKTVIPGIILLVLVLAGSLLPACQAGSASKLKVVSGSSLLTYILQQVGGDRVEVYNLIPPSQHPADFNVKPGDIQKLAEADLLILHGWPGEGYAEKFIASANNPDLVVEKAGVNGNWMTPPVQIAATWKVSSILQKADPENASGYNATAGDYVKRIESKQSEIQEKLYQAAAAGTRVIASFRQADFLQWAGLNVVATYQDPETLTPQVVKDLVEKGKAEGVRLVVDNLQNGQDAGKGLAEELGAVQINLSNFPGGLENTETWEKAIDRNIELLLEALSQK